MEHKDKGCFRWSNEWSVKVEHKDNRVALSGVMSGVLRWSTWETEVFWVE